MSTSLKKPNSNLLCPPQEKSSFQVWWLTSYLLTERERGGLLLTESANRKG